MKKLSRFKCLLIIISAVLSLVACNSPADKVEPPASGGAPPAPETADLEFTLQTLIHDGGLAYIGVGGEIDAVINPDLTVQPGDVVRLVLLNGDGMQHDLYLPDFDVKTSFVSKIGERAEIVFEVGDMQPGSYVYYCTVSGHRQAGQEGKFIVENKTD